MEAWIQKIGQMADQWAYVLLFISAFVENIFPPAPGDTVTVIGAYFVGTGHLDFFWVYLATSLGSISGFMALYTLAYVLEWKVLEKYQRRWGMQTHLERVTRWFHRYGYGIIVANRFLSGARSVISIVAGLSRLKPVLVFVYASISVLVWNGLLIYLGAFVGKRWDDILAYIKLYNRIIVIGLVVGLMAYLVYRFGWKRLGTGWHSKGGGKGHE